MRILMDVMFAILKLVIAAMLTSLVLFIVAWICRLDVWVAVTIGIMTIITGIIVGKLSDGRL